jgi:formate hydrogenlyase subunit 3/multisubunit Na+/H+ antiporter MnhD subunit
MGEIVQSIFRTMGVFMAYPWLAAVVGVLFVTLGWKMRRWGVVTIGVMWVLYAAYETGMKQRWLCTGECNIRVDLLLIYPILILSSIGAALSLRGANQRRETKSGRQRR